MCQAVIVDRIYEDAERILPLDPGLTVHEVVARLADAHPDLFTAQDPEKPLPAFPAGVRFRLPIVAVGTDPDGNPDYILQRTWHTRTLAEGETIAFVVVPRGGGGGSNAGKQIAGVVAMIALTIAAPYLAVGLGGAAFGTISGGMASLTLAGRLATMGIIAGGAALMNALQPKADGPAVQEQKVYSAAAANNSLQPGAIVPVPYGLNRYAPPFSTRAYVEYENNEQFLYQVLCPGKGHHAIKRVLYGDTTVWTAEDGYTDAIEGLELEFCEPGEGVTLFPAGVVLASEVNGQEIPNPNQWPPHGAFDPVWLGGFVVNAAGEANRIDRIAIDFYMPEGIYAQGSGGISAFGADLMAQYREIDDSGDPVGSWTTFVGDGTGENGGKRYWGATKEPQRYTEKVDVPKGRYEVRVAATYPFQPADSDAKNRTLWGGLKGYLADFTTPPGVTQIAVKIQAGHDLSELSANQFFVESVRKLPVWDPDEETWSEPVETQSIAWAVADWLMNTDYGGGIAEGDIDLNWLAAYATFWDERGDTFNGIFDREWMLLDGANAILRCGRSQVVRIGDRIGFTRYEAKDVKRAVFTPRSIVKGSFKRRWIFSDDTLPDSKYCKFLDAETWQYDEIKVAAPGYSSSRPVEETMFGFVDREHVWREGVTDCAINAYRDREFASFTTEWDGKRLVRGDPVLAVHPLMANAFARIDGVDSTVITLDRDIAQALTQQWVDDAADWTNSNAGAPGSVADLPGSFVEDGSFGRLVAVRSGTSTNPIRSKRTIPAPLDDTIIELQVRWRIVGEGEGRIVARCVSLDGDYAQLSVVGDATDLVSGGGQRLTRFYFANPATASGIGGVTAWHAAAKELRFGVNVNAGEGGAEVRIAQIRPRAVHGLQDRIYIRGKRGREWGFCDVASIPDDRTIVLDETHLAEVETADGSIASILPGPRAEKAHLALFQDDARPFDGLVISMRPTGPNRVDVLLVRDDPRPYEADETGSAPPYLPPRKPPTPPDRPIVTGLSARLENGDFDVQLVGGWLPAPGARAYVAKVSYDEGDTWEHVYRGRNPSFTAPTLRQAQRVAVRAIGKLPGPWVYADIAELAVPPVKPPRNKTPPGPPTDLAVDTGFTIAAVDWVNPADDDLAHVAVLVHTSDDVEAATVAGSIIAPGDSLVVADLAEDTDYWFWAYAVDLDGNPSTITGPVTDKTKKSVFGPPNTDPPGEPTAPQLTPGFNLVLLEWTNPADDDLADIEVWVNSADNLGAAVLTTTARAPGASAVVGELPNDAERWFWLRAVDYWGNKSEFVACGSATTLDSPFGDRNSDPPGEPTSPSLSPGFHLVGIGWTNPADDDLADIEVWAHTANSLGSAVQIGSARAPGESFVAAGLGNNATWWFWIRAVDYWGNKSDFVACGSATTFAGTADIANNAIDSNMIQNLAVLTAKLANNAVNVNKIANGAVEAGKIAAAAVGTTHLDALAVTAAKIAASAIETAKLADGAVATAKIASEAVDSSRIADLAVLEAKLAANAVTVNKIATNAVTSTKITDGAISTPKLTANAVTANEIAAGAVITTKLAAGAVTANEIAAGAVVTDKLAAHAVTASKMVLTDTTNLILNGAFEAPDGTASSDGWSQTGTMFIGSLAFTGGPRLFGAAFNGTGVNNLVTWDAYIPVAEAESFASRLDIYRHGAANGSFLLQVIWYDENKSVVSGPTPIFLTDGTKSNGWSSHTGTIVTVPAGVHFMRWRCGTQATHTNQWWAATNFIVRKAANAELIVDGAVLAEKIAAGAVVAGKIAAGAVTATEIAAGTITSAKIAAGAITTTELAANSVTAAKIVAATITAAEIATGAITTAKIAAGAITTTELAAGAVVADKIAANSISASKLILTDLNNLILNGSFEGADGSLLSDGWTTTNGATIGALTGGFAGHRSFGIRFSQSGGGVNNVATWNTFIPVSEGESFAPRIDAFRGNGNGTLNLWVVWYNADKSATVGANFPRQVTTAHPNWTWASYAGSIVTAPTGAHFMSWRCYTSPAHTADWWGATNFIVRKAANAELIVDGAIIATKIAAGAVTTAKLAAGAVTAGTIAAGAVTAAKIYSGEVQADRIQAGNIATNAIQAVHILAGAVIAGKIGANAVTANEIAAGTITSNKLYAGEVQASRIQALNIATNAIEAQHIAAGAIIAGKIAAGAITAANMIVNGVITSNKLYAGAVQASRIQADNIATNAITATKLAAGAIVAGKISAGAIDAAELFVNGVIITDLIEANAVQAPRYTNPSNVNWVGRTTGQQVVVAEVTLPVTTGTTFVEGQFTCQTVAAIATGGGNVTSQVQLRINGVTIYSEPGASQSGEGSTTLTNRGFGFSNPGAGDRTVQLVVIFTWTGNLNFAATQVNQIRLKATAPKR